MCYGQKINHKTFTFDFLPLVPHTLPKSYKTIEPIYAYPGTGLLFSYPIFSRTSDLLFRFAKFKGWPKQKTKVVSMLTLFSGFLPCFSPKIFTFVTFLICWCLFFLHVRQYSNCHYNGLPSNIYFIYHCLPVPISFASSPSTLATLLLVLFLPGLPLATSPFSWVLCFLPLKGSECANVRLSHTVSTCHGLFKDLSSSLCA